MSLQISDRKTVHRHTNITTVQAWETESITKVSEFISSEKSVLVTIWFFSGRPRPKTTRERNITTLLYLLSAAIATTGAAYAAVPLYRVFCQTTSYGGTVKEGHDTEKVETMVKSEDRLLTIRFNADTAAQMRWNFKPQQPVVYVHPGETALAFYTARNPTEKYVTANMLKEIMFAFLSSGQSMAYPLIMLCLSKLVRILTRSNVSVLKNKDLILEKRSHTITLFSFLSI